MDRAERQIRTDLTRRARSRDLIEPAIAPHVFLSLTYSMKHSRHAAPHTIEWCNEVMPDLETACAELWPSATPEAFAGLTDLTARVVAWAFFPKGDKRKWVNGYLSCVYWLMDLLDRDMLVLAEDSPGRRAAEKIIAAIEGDPNRENSDKSARKNARRIQERLESLGLFQQRIIYVEAEAA